MIKKSSVHCERKTNETQIYSHLRTDDKHWYILCESHFNYDLINFV